MPAQSQSVDDGPNAEHADSSASSADAAKSSIGGRSSRAPTRRDKMAVDNEQIIRKAYQTAEDYDIPGWVAAFTAQSTWKSRTSMPARAGTAARSCRCN